MRLDKENIPAHIAIIPDGNRRWARKMGVHEFEGHKRGAERLIEIMRSAKDLGIKTITFYSFSTENWTRPQEEIDALMTLLVHMLEGERENMVKDGVRYHTIGDLSPFKQPVLDSIEETKRVTSGGSAINLVMALNYGARDEIKRTVHKLVTKVAENGLPIQEIDEKMISSHLDTSSWPDPDLILRTSGELRLSNFLLWQASYAELLPLDIFWPEFTPNHLLQACISFQNRERRLGGGA